MSPGGIAMLLLMALGSAYMVANDLVLVPLGIAGALIGIVVIYYCFFKPEIGFYLVTVFAFFMFYPGHVLGFDMSFNPIFELLIIFLFAGTLFKVKTNRQKSSTLLKTAVSILMICNFVYFILQAFNTNLPSLVGWHAPFRRFTVCTIIYYLAYQLINTPEKLKFFFKFWVIMSFLAGAYGCYQQWFGYLPSEMRYIKSIPSAWGVLYQGGQLRKFSFLADVVTFGILSGAMAVFTLLWAIYEKRPKRKYLMFFISLILLLGMAYSGTRTTNILLPAAIALYGIVTIQNKVTLIALFCSILAIMFIFFAPIHSNPTLNRIRTTFDAKDASLNVRDRNRQYIQPYIYKHPIGGGLSTAGETGKLYFPGHPLAGFPPDSGLLRVALETGWVGLVISLLLQLIFFYQGIAYYFQIRNQEYRKFIILMMATLFPVVVAQYSQETVGQLPFGIFFFACLSLITRVKEFDETELKRQLLTEQRVIERNQQEV